jgi:hypothetical protein
MWWESVFKTVLVAGAAAVKLTATRMALPGGTFISDRMVRRDDTTSCTRPDGPLVLVAGGQVLPEAFVRAFHQESRWRAAQGRPKGLPQLFRDEGHERVQGAQNPVQDFREGLTGRPGRGGVGAGGQAGFDHLDVPIAKIVPEKTVEGARRLGGVEGVHVAVHGARATAAKRAAIHRSSTARDASGASAAGAKPARFIITNRLAFHTLLAKLRAPTKLSSAICMSRPGEACVTSAKRRASVPNFFMTSRGSITLLRDFDILRPCLSRTMPWMKTSR